MVATITPLRGGTGGCRGFHGKTCTNVGSAVSKANGRNDTKACGRKTPIQDVIEAEGPAMIGALRVRVVCYASRACVCEKRCNGATVLSDRVRCIW